MSVGVCTSFVKGKHHNLKRSAERRKLTFRMSSKDIQKLLSNPICHFCGVFCDLEVTGGVQGDDTFTFERLNPLNGYVPSNVVCACHKCNNKKGKDDEFLVKLAPPRARKSVFRRKAG
jgi:hypothetical protein